MEMIAAHDWVDQGLLWSGELIIVDEDAFAELSAEGAVDNWFAFIEAIVEMIDEDEEDEWPNELQAESYEYSYCPVCD